MIIVARPDGSDQQGVYATPPVDYPHSKGLSGDYLLTWSLDGTTLGFTQGSELYTVPVSGGEPRRVTANAALDTDPDWQPTVPSSGLALARIAFPQPACATKKSIATITITDAQSRPLSGVALVVRGGTAPARAVTSATGTAKLTVQASSRHKGRLALTVSASQTGRPTVTKRVSLPGCR
jgi:hypothetical protein